jgi:hypothetical protein
MARRSLVTAAGGAGPRQVATAAPFGAPRRTRRLLAAAVDILALGAALTGAFLVATIYLLARSALGRDDVSDLDSLIAVAIEVSIIPVWIAWQTMSVASHGATVGQRLLGLHVDALPRAHEGARYLRLLLHPVSAPAWLWLALAVWLAGAPATLALTPLFAAGAVAAAGIASGVIVIVRPPGARPIHDVLARTRLVSNRGATHG